MTQYKIIEDLPYIATQKVAIKKDLFENEGGIKKPLGLIEKIKKEDSSHALITNIDDTLTDSPAKKIAIWDAITNKEYLLNPEWRKWAYQTVKAWVKQNPNAESIQFYDFLQNVATDKMRDQIKAKWTPEYAKAQMYKGAFEFIESLPEDMKKLIISRDFNEIVDVYQTVINAEFALGENFPSLPETDLMQQATFPQNKYAQILNHYGIKSVVLLGDSVDDQIKSKIIKNIGIDVTSIIVRPENEFDSELNKDYEIKDVIITPGSFPLLKDIISGDFDYTTNEQTKKEIRNTMNYNPFTAINQGN